MDGFLQEYSSLCTWPGPELRFPPIELGVGVDVNVLQQQMIPVEPSPHAF